MVAYSNSIKSRLTRLIMWPMVIGLCLILLMTYVVMNLRNAKLITFAEQRVEQLTSA